MSIHFDLNMLEELHYPEHADSAIRELDALRWPLAEYHTAVMEMRYDRTSDGSPGFVVILIGDDTDTGDQRMSNTGWGPGEWCAEFIYQLMKRVSAEVEVGSTEGELPCYSTWPEELQRYVMSIVVPVEFKDADVEFLDEHLVAFPLRGGELQPPKAFQMEG